ncbi:MAG: DNA-binding protein [Desulfobacterales bacterium CG23_combo_of_CG06-09_8_20_14_all_51_8]|nr:MAG: DNA-binding protein [Desulfobacterales bacterium CG23_combo_of_CG06-09_8_20_14_all_51_8]
MKNRDQQVLVQYRIQQAKAALEEANILLSYGKTTFGAINRAYYAMFYAVLAILQCIDKVPRKHSGAIALFDAEFVKKGIFPKELSRFLHNAFESRQTSDYLAITPISPEEAQEIMHHARIFITAVEKYLRDISLE